MVTVFGHTHHGGFKRQFNLIITDLVGIDYNRDESMMPCEIKVLIELYGPIDTGVIIWITNIIGKIDCISFYLPSFDSRFGRYLAFLIFSKRYSNWRYIYVFYFCSHIDLVSRFFYFCFFFFFFFFSDNRSTTQNWPFPFLNAKWF